ncbi:MAG: hypothetical protein BGO57_04130 [Sphingomonadales bacterium 63-6]|nr:MAG: hypothetical protein BGO57_04130 [Sphingomonadales bacterium 63-6]
MTSVDPILVDTRTACHLLGIKRTSLFLHLKNQNLERRKVGRKTLIPMESIRRFAERSAF